MDLIRAIAEDQRLHRRHQAAGLRRRTAGRAGQSGRRRHRRHVHHRRPQEGLRLLRPVFRVRRADGGAGRPTTTSSPTTTCAASGSRSRTAPRVPSSPTRSRTSTASTSSPSPTPRRCSTRSAPATRRPSSRTTRCWPTASRRATASRPSRPRRRRSSYGFAVNKGQNAELLKKFNAGLKNLKESGRYDEIVNSYLGEDATTADNSFFGLIKSTFPILLEGLKMTVFLTVVSIAIALGARRHLRSVPGVASHLVARHRHHLRRHLPRHTASGAGLLHLLRHPVGARVSRCRR